MLLPTIFGEIPVEGLFGDLNREIQRLGCANVRQMKADISEHDDHYEVAMDLPGINKDDIEIGLQDGNLIITAKKTVTSETNGKVIRRERYTGMLQRSFYVGDEINENDVSAKLEHGVLTVTVPKKEEKIPEKKTIMIEG